MNIEAMKLALEALQGGYGDTKSWHKAIESAIKALRTAIQQAEAQQPATPEPVAIGYINEMDELVKYPAPCIWMGQDCPRAKADRATHECYQRIYTHPAPSVPATGEPVGVNQLRKELSDANDFIQSLADLCVKYETLLGYRKTKAPEGASELAEARGESNVNTELDLAMPDSICDHVFVLDPKSSIRICNKCGTVECKKHTHQAPSVPEGYVLVPIEPTQAMMNVQTWDFSSFYSPREIWAAMLAAKDGGA